MNLPQGNFPHDSLGDRMAKSWKLPTGSEIESSLSAAERLLSRAQSQHHHLRERSFSFASLMVAVAISLSASVFAVMQYGPFGTMMVTGLTLTILPLGMMLMLATRKYITVRRQLRNNTQLELASEIADMIRTSYPEVAQREEWSYMRIETTKLRLSAFPLTRERGARDW